MEQIQVKELYEACKKQMEKGNGNKYIITANDNEGNEYHGMFYLFTETVPNSIYNKINDSAIIEKEKLIILG